ncbi:hypothetical protein L873DRAFT_1844571 [Choiromyces venosus 120613-1]|uniref:Uncharacterized protein n=1 Tax=Choiromyces venosus 120613-1 TaxID=1336337 RepID=A0A3N4JHM0_9PEZI|nr:hypothetical protein L873DRAFT_1844571 [Choiromyces venosus 120613-1]
MVRNGKEEKEVGRSPDPEENSRKGLPVMVEVGGVRWDDGFGGVEEGLKEAGFEICSGIIPVKRKEAEWVRVVDKVDERVAGLETISGKGKGVEKRKDWMAEGMGGYEDRGVYGGRWSDDKLMKEAEEWQRRGMRVVKVGKPMGFGEGLWKGRRG